MRIHTDSHTPETIVAALRFCQRAGLVDPDVEIDVLRPHGSRSRARAFEVQLGAPPEARSFLAQPARDRLAAEIGDDDSDLRKAVRRASIRRSRNGYGTASEYLPKTATWHEWGYFLAALFADDVDMVAGPYTGAGDLAAEGEGYHLTALGYEWQLSRGRIADFLGDVHSADTVAA